MRRQITQVDTFTGEVLEGGTLVYVPPKRRNGFRDGWVAMAQDPMVKLAQAGVGEQALRVFLVLVGRLDFENFVNVSQADVGRLLRMDRADVSKAFKRLSVEGVLIPGPKVAGRGTYRLDPTYGWKGSAVNHRGALVDRMKAARIEGVVASS